MACVQFLNLCRLVLIMKSFGPLDMTIIFPGGLTVTCLSNSLSLLRILWLRSPVDLFVWLRARMRTLLGLADTC